MNIHHPQLVQESTQSQSVLEPDEVNRLGGTTDSVNKAPQACLSCRQQKKKCDRAIPSCGLCTRVKRACNYASESLSAANSEVVLSLQKKVKLLEAQLDVYINQGSLISTDPRRSASKTPAISRNGLGNTDQEHRAIPSVFFLDGAAFVLERYRIERPILQLPQVFEDVCPTPTTVQNIISSYYITSHVWLPIISKARLYQSAGVPLGETSPDLALLFLCMRLVTQRLPQALEDPQTPYYLFVKEFHFLVESAGILSIHFLQAGILLATYELGHAIFPAAYLTIGRCVKDGHAMNICETAQAPRMLPPPSGWTEVEERRRVWWAIIILDRYVALGNPGLPLSAEDLSRGDTLPCTETAWNRGNASVEETLFLSSPPGVPAGRFARLCQASHLLGKILRHGRDRTLDDDERFPEAIQLNRLLQALSSVISSELSEDSCVALRSTMAVCYSGMMVLNRPYSGIESPEFSLDFSTPREFQKHALATLKSAGREITNLSASLQEDLNTQIDQCSPLIAHCLYQAGSVLAWFYRKLPNDIKVAEAVEVLKETLRRLDKRWKIAGR